MDQCRYLAKLATRIKSIHSFQSDVTIPKRLQDCYEVVKDGLNIG